MQSRQKGNQNTMKRHAARHVAIRVEGKAETSMVAVVGVDLDGTPAGVCMEAEVPHHVLLWLTRQTIQSREVSEGVLER